MTGVFTIRRGDLRPRPRATLYDDAGTIVDLTGATVTFVFMDRNYTVLFEHAATAVGPLTNGVAEYQWAGTETDREHGDYLAYFKTVLPGSQPMTEPNGEEIVVRIRRRGEA